MPSWGPPLILGSATQPATTVLDELCKTTQLPKRRHMSCYWCRVTRTTGKEHVIKHTGEFPSVKCTIRFMVNTNHRFPNAKCSAVTYTQQLILEL